MSEDQVNATTVAILREAMESAADRLAAKSSAPAAVPPGGCPACGRKQRVFTSGHLYALMGALFFFGVAIFGAVSK